MSSDPQPPPLTDGSMRLVDLLEYARIYDEISSGSHWPAQDFVTWLKGEIRLESRQRRSPLFPELRDRRILKASIAA